jgi:hypothetical protein
MKLEPTKLHLLEERMELIWLLSFKGYGDTDIAEIMNIDRTWVYRLRQRKPKKWEPTIIEKGMLRNK